MHEYLDDSFDAFRFFRANEQRLGHLKADAEAMLGDSATLVTTSGVMAAALLAGKWRIVRDDLPLQTPLDVDGERRYRLFAIALGRYLACLSLESKGQLLRRDEGWTPTDHPDNQGIDLPEEIDLQLARMIDLEHFGSDAFTCDVDSEP